MLILPLLWLVLGSVAALPADIPSSAIAHGITNDTAAIANRTFDYIIAGGGLTGLTVASRLSEDPNITVLVIEAGYDNHADPRVNDVRTYGQAFDSPDLDHRIRSTPVKWQNNIRHILVAGKTLGGSGSLNGASWTKGSASQYDMLPVLTGDDSWGWDEFNEYMLKVENFHPPTSYQETEKGANFTAEDHGYGGPVQVCFGAEMYGGTQLPALEAAETLWPSFTRNVDAASGRTTGGTIIPNMLYPDEQQNRSSPFTAYAQRQVEERSNFVILTGHRVTEIVWADSQDNTSGSPLQAAGVHFQHSPTSPLEFVSVSREVLLAAGSLQSPQILELSGIGNPEILEAAGIEVKLALPGVGKNMQEQAKNSVVYQARDGIDFNGSGPPSAIAFPTAAQLLGPVISEEWYANASSSLDEFSRMQADMGLVPNATASQMILQSQLDNLFRTEANDSAAAEVFFFIDTVNNAVGIDNWNLIVLSRGTAHIQSKDPWQHPIVEPSYFHHPLDLAFQIAINKASRSLFQTSPLSSYVTHEISPGYDLVPLNASDAVWEQWVKGSFTSVWHYISTTAMMKKELCGVVDGRARVYGTGNVRVVDAGVVPVQLSAHLSSSLYGVGEKVAGMIVEDWEGK